MKYIMCIDGGGTAIKYNVMNTEGKLLYTSKSVPTPYSKEELVKTIESFIENYEEEIAGLTFSMPGFINSTTGYIAKGGSLSYLDNTYFYDLFEHLNIPISIENDGRSFAYAEGAVGAAKGCRDYICFTIGTGIGTGIVVNGEVLKGNTFRGGEYGMSYVMIDGVPKMHHHTCSTSALIEMYKAAKNISAEEKVEGYAIFEQGKTDPLVEDVLNRWYRNIGIAILNLAVTFNPEKILLGGGVSAQPDLAANIEKAICEFAGGKLWTDAGFGVPIEPCLYRNDAGFIGAFYHFKQTHPEIFN